MDAASMAAGLKQSGRNYSPWIAVFNMCNAAIGSGVLSFPYAFRQTGVFGGLFYTGIIWLVEVGALLLLIRTAEKYKTKSYQDLVVALFGPSMAIVTSITILVFLGGSLVSYFIITGDVFEPIFTDWFGENSLFADRRSCSL
jgi:amino acid permease